MVESENAWVFDSLVCFLNGPVWNTPLQSFIEEKSLIFEPNNIDNPEYHKIFEEYKNLVDLMLASYMEDIGISPMQFEEACNRGHTEFVSKHFDHSLFEQIWAANDYEMFKRMMAQRNVELQLQALELLEQKYGIMPESFIPYKRPQSTKVTAGESSSETQEKANDLEEEIMEEVIKKFPYDDNEISLETKKEDAQYLKEEKEILKEALKTIEDNVNSQKVAAKLDNQKTVDRTVEDKEPTASVMKKEISFDKKPISTEIDKIELKKRQEYLRGQRDKLVALKKEVRKKQLDVDNSLNEKSKVRPKSARVAQAVMEGDSLKFEDTQQLQIRKTLAERLKAEVVSVKHEN